MFSLGILVFYIWNESENYDLNNGRLFADYVKEGKRLIFPDWPEFVIEILNKTCIREPSKRACMQEISDLINEVFPDKKYIKLISFNKPVVDILNGMIKTLPMYVSTESLREALRNMERFPWEASDSIIPSPDIRMTTWRIADPKNPNRYYFGEIKASSKKPEGRGILFDIVQERIWIRTIRDGKTEGYCRFFDKEGNTYFGNYSKGHPTDSNVSRWSEMNDSRIYFEQTSFF